MNKIIDLLWELHYEKSLIRMVFGGKRNKTDICHKIIIRPVLLKGELLYQVEYVYPKKVEHKNLIVEDYIILSEQLITDEFKQINIFTNEADYQILASNPSLPKIIKQNPTKKPQGLSHNQEKNYIIPDGIPCDFLIRLGVMNDSGKVLQKYYAKFRQINRFLEITRDVLDSLPKDREITIIDFGCGKAYLTFALYHYLILQLHYDARIIGLDLKEDVVNFCNDISESLQYDKLHFELGDIAEYNNSASADMVVTLHACDTATDFALAKASNWGASIILSVPCCQHELFDQIDNKLHYPMLKHGILKERFCAILTDTIRTLKLEEWGYNVTMIEFTSLEHTAKNIMIRAVKTGKYNSIAAKECNELMNYWQIKPTISIL